MTYVLFGVLVALVAVQAVFVAWLVREHTRERTRLYSLAFANNAPGSVPHAVAMVREEWTPPSPRVAPMPSAGNGEDANLEPVGGAF